MNTGVAVAVAMDSGYKAFGDQQGAIDLVEEVAKGSEMGKLIGNGPAAVGRHFNNPRVACVKNQSIAAYDPRVLQANGVTYATSAMGADHTAGNLVAEYAQGNLELCKPDGAVEASKGIQPVFAFVDCVGLCLFASFPLGSPEGGGAFFEAMGAKLGKPFGPEDMIGMGMQTIQAEREFNRKAGLTSADDRLPLFFKEEPLPPHNAVFQVSDQDLDGTFQ
jgi:aldehyde:ferredoxin oxidoreductase